jgi:aerobic carbon-monoxide dehydrogenase medium subunit
MIPGPFVYHRPKSIAEVSGLLTQFGDEARVLAGGHSIIPMMKLRMATPQHLIDIADITDLKGITRDGKMVTIGAMTTQAELIASDVLTSALPIIRETSHLIADPQVRYMGTLGGNVANGDPGNDMPAVMMALDATYRLENAEGSRRVPAREFYLGPYTTAIEHGEILHSIEIPLPSMSHGFAYEKLKRKIGDYATAAAAVIMTVSRSKIVNCSIALTNLADVPLYCENASKAIIGTSLDKPALVAAAREAGKLMSPSEDGRGPAEYRASVGGVILTRALQRAFARSNH